MCAVLSVYNNPENYAASDQKNYHIALSTHLLVTSLQATGGQGTKRAVTVDRFSSIPCGIRALY